MSGNTIQSVDRAMAMLRLLAAEGPMTASELADEMCLNQSTASRQLKSLMQSGFVRKPTFHSFDVDYGLLCFAGEAIRSFPLVQQATSACEKICQNGKLGAAVCVLHEKTLIYLARRDPGVESSTIQLVNHTNWPLHRSSMGLVLAHEKGREYFIETVGTNLSEDQKSDYSVGELYGKVEEEVSRDGIFDWGEGTGYKFNIASSFPGDDRMAALGIFSHVMSMSEDVRKLLKSTISQYFISQEE